MSTKIVFFYPSKTIGGAQLLFIRMANEFAKCEKYCVKIIDFDDGYLRKHVSKDIEVISYIIDKHYYFDKKTIVLVPLSMIESIVKVIKLDNDGKFLFWGIHPENTIDILRGSHRLKKYFKNIDFMIKLINFIQYKRIKDRLLDGLANNTVIFMDKANRDRTFEFYNIVYNYETYLPIPIVENNIQFDFHKRKKNKIAWIGRLSNDKIYSLLFILKELNHTDMKDLEVYIIGDGSHKHLLKEGDYPNIKLTILGFISNDYLSNVLIENEIGMVVGMGTSILESSIMQLPSLLVDPSYVKLKETYRPRWLFQTEGYTLGSFYPIHGENSFKDLMQEYISDNSNNLGLQCFNYVRNNHLLSEVVKKLENYFE